MARQYHFFRSPNICKIPLPYNRFHLPLKQDTRLSGQICFPPAVPPSAQQSPLMSRKGFVKKLEKGDIAAMFSFPERCGNMQYFVPIVSAVLRCDDISAVYWGDNTFAAILKEDGSDMLVKKLCDSLSELGIYIASKEIDVMQEEITDTDTAVELLDKMYYSLGEKNLHKNNEAYSEVFSALRREMRYSPQNDWSIASAAKKTGISGSHFQRLYKKYFNISFTVELIIFRIERAEYLLKNSFLSVHRIAVECGYTNSAHFMRQFSKALL